MRWELGRDPTAKEVEDFLNNDNSNTESASNFWNDGVNEVKTN